MNNKKGITLIALVISIIILIILAAVSIGMTIGEKGIITRTVGQKKNGEIKEVSEDIKSGINRLQYYEVKGSEGGVNLKLLSTDSMNQFRSFISGKIAYYGASGDKTKLIYYNDKGYYTSLIDANGNVSVVEGIVISKDDHMQLDGTQKGTIYIGLDDEDENVVFGIPSGYEEYFSRSNGELTILKDLPYSITITVEKSGELYGSITLNPDDAAVITTASISGSSGSYVRQDGTIDYSKFEEEVQLGTDNVYAGYCKDNNIWKLCVYTKGAGNGEMFNNLTGRELLFKRIEFENKNIYTRIQQIDILDGVTDISRAAFWNFFNAKALSVGKDVEIFNSLFYKTNDLYEIYQDEYLTSLDNDRMSNLETVYWNAEDPVLFIEYYQMFDGSIHRAVGGVGLGIFGEYDNISRIKNIYFGSSVKTMPEGLFQNTTITSFKWPKSVVEIEDYAFANCKFEVSPISLDYKGTYGECVFWCSSIKEFRVPYACIEIPEQTCIACTSLETVVLNEGLKTIDKMAFAGCNKLKNVVVPSTLEIIGSSAFAGCVSLKEIDLSKCENSLKTIDDLAFKNCDLQKLYLPKELQTMGEYAFGKNDNLKEIYYNCRGMEITKDATLWVGYTSNNIDVDIPVEKLTIGPDVYTLPECGFWYMNHLKSVTIPRNVGAINHYCFAYCTNLETFNIESGVKAISECILMESDKVTSISIPDSVSILSSYAFYNAKGIKNVYWDAINPLITDNDVHLGYVFLCVTEEDSSRDNRIETITFGPHVKVIPKGLFYCQSKVKNITFSDSIEIIEDQAFMSCASLESINLGNGIKEIGYRAFYYCFSASNVLKIPDSCLKVGEQAFFYNFDLNGLDLGNGIETIGADAFYGVAYYGDTSSCTVVLPPSLTKIGLSAFTLMSCNKIVCNMPNGYSFVGRVNSTGNNTASFVSCQVKEIEITDSVSSVSQYEFAGSTVEKATVTTNITIDDLTDYGVFASCSKLKELYYGGIDVLSE